MKIPPETVELFKNALAEVKRNMPDVALEIETSKSNFKVPERLLFGVFFMLSDNMSYDDTHPMYAKHPRRCALKAEEMAAFRKAGYKDSHIATMMRSIL